MRAPKLFFLPAIIFVCALLPCRVLAADAAERDQEWVAKVVSVEGSIQSKRVGETEWASVQLNDTFREGDIIRVREHSRAAVLLQNETVLRLDQETSITFAGVDKEETFLLKVISGSVHFFSRTPKKLKVITPFVNAAVGGTEFTVQVQADGTSVSVLEGKVTASNEAGSLTLGGGQSALAQAGKAPEMRIVVRPRDAVQWALYYPPILDYQPTDFAGGPETGWQAMIHRSIEYYWENDLASAFASLPKGSEGITDPRFFIYRAALLLSVGRVDEATVDIERALKLDPLNGRAFALQSVIDVAQNRKEKALDRAKKAVELSPESSGARVALSYAQQANFDLQGALKNLEEVVKLSPENALAWTRLGEMLLSLGYLDKALDAANAAVRLNPKLARTQTVLGFAYLTRIKIKESQKTFRKAIELDQGDPLPRLGLGLALIRDGKLKDGRREIEIAVALDPNNSLIRSYLGKAYFEEKRDHRARDQYAIAKELDPLDPTPWFYDAIRKQTVNRPVEALEDIQKSIELNDNRAVYRSRLQLDQDLAARSASLARIYNDLGFQQLALVEGWKSLDIDPTNYSAHRLLSDSYSALPRHDIARVSELLKAQLLQPININPVQPQLAESSLVVPSGLGPADPSFNEFNALFNRNRFTVLASGIAGEHGTLADEVVQSGLWGKFSYSVGQFHYQTDGIRANNDQERNIYNVFTQVALTPQTSVLAEYRNTDREFGDLNLLFDPDNFFAKDRTKISTESIRFGLHHSFTPKSDLIASFIYRNLDGNISSSASRTEAEDVGYSAEAQYIYHSERFNLVTGAGHLGFDVKAVQTTPGFPPVLTKTNSPHSDLYLYTQINYPETVTWTLGGSADFIKMGGFDTKAQQFNPKFGVVWRPFPSTTLRLAAFRTLMRSGVAEETFSGETLEPTQVAGFNQFFQDGLGTDAWRYGVGIDHKFSAHVYAGAEFSKRDLTARGLLRAPGDVVESDLEERLVRAYVYWAPHPWFAMGPEYQFEQFRRPKEFLIEDISRLNTHKLALGISFFHPSGFLARLKPTFVSQEGKFLRGFEPSEQGELVPVISSDDSNFFVLDAAIGYRLPKRWGLITIEARNLFDKSFRFQDTDPANPSIVPARTILGRFTVAF